jgi:IS1 family transposase
MFVKIRGETHYIWRAVDHEGEVLESYVTTTRDKAAALTFLRKALKRHGRPQEVVTDGLRTYGAALKALGRGDDREMGRWMNNRAENAHFPKRRGRAMLRFRRDAKSADVRLRPRLGAQSLQPGALALSQIKLQGETCCRACRVARPLRCMKDDLGRAHGDEFAFVTAPSQVFN